MTRFQSILSPQLTQDNQASNISSFTIESQASEALQMEHNAIAIIRMVEELLGISRALKESWILNQVYVKEEPEEQEKDVKYNLEKKLESAMKLILNQQNKELEGEVDSDGFESDFIEEKEEVKEESKESLNTSTQKQEQITSKDQVPNDFTMDPFQPINDNDENGESPGSTINQDFQLNDFSNPIDLENVEQNMEDLDFEKFETNDSNNGATSDGSEDVIMLD